MTVVDNETVDDGVFDGVSVLDGVLVLVGVRVCEKDAVVVLVNETDGVCDALAALEREAVCDEETVEDAEMVVDGVFDGVRVLEGVPVPVGVIVCDTEAVVVGEGVPIWVTNAVPPAVHETTAAVKTIPDQVTEISVVSVAVTDAPQPPSYVEGEGRNGPDLPYISCCAKRLLGVPL